MWILKAIFQAIGQAVTFVLPVSESGHSAIFHNFAGRFTNACSQLTGVIHIGIAIGLIAAFFKLFKMLFVNFIGAWNDLFHKRLDVKNIKLARSFMYMTILSFVPMLFYLIPAGKYGTVFDVFHRTSYNQNIAGEGLCMLMTGVLLFTTIGLAGKKLNPLPSIAQALLLGVVVFLAVPTAGCSLIGAVFCIGLIVGFDEKNALRYSVVMAVMILLVRGIIELCVGVTKVSIVSAIIGLVIGAAVSYLTAKLLTFIIKKQQLKYIAVYDIAIGFICMIIGVFEIITK
ncbi:MAG: undecaprenyl-diphosphate phosphatase [Clostridium sp.]|nr:undecaprenyl-diphosphate phosphatase [Clostridium sp.]